MRLLRALIIRFYEFNLFMYTTKIHLGVKSLLVIDYIELFSL